MGETDRLGVIDPSTEEQGSTRLADGSRSTGRDLPGGHDAP